LPQKPIVVKNRTILEVTDSGNSDIPDPTDWTLRSPLMLTIIISTSKIAGVGTIIILNIKHPIQNIKGIGS